MMCLLAAMSVTEGDLLPGGATVISVYRNVRRGRVRIALDDGDVLERSAVDRVVVAHRGVPDFPPGCGLLWRYFDSARAARRISRT